MNAAVFDTNVVVSGILSPSGIPGRLLDAILDGLCRPVVTDSIMAEYEDVLCRPKFHFPPARIHLLLDVIRSCALSAPSFLLRFDAPLPDPDDAIFLEAAASLNVPLVTGNGKYFPRRCVGEIRVLTPSAFFQQLR